MHIGSRAECCCPDCCEARIARAAAHRTMPKYYVLYDGKPVAGPYRTEEAACKVVANMRDPELYTVDVLEKDQS